MADETSVAIAEIRTRLGYLCEALDDVKDSLARSSASMDKVGQYVARMDERMKTVESRISDLHSFERDTKDFVSKSKGGIAVALFLFTALQGFFGWFVSKVWDNSTENAARIRLLEQQRKESHEVSRTLQGQEPQKDR